MVREDSAANAAGLGGPTFIIAGSMRCGTSALNSYLREHPDVVVATTKEVHYFDEKFHLGFEWYSRQFPGADRAVAVGEATPNYVFSAEAMGRIAKVLPSVRLIIMLRNPIDRAYSHYWHDRTRGKIDVPFAAVIERECAGAETETAYIDRGRYLDQLDRVFRLFPRNAVLVSTFEELAQDPESVYATMCRFIGVSDEYQPAMLGTRVNAYTEFRSLTVRKLGKRLPGRARQVVGRLNQKQAHVEYPPMAPETRVRLSQVFADANRGLPELVGMQFPEWT